jgi:hypothetical protein
MKVFSREMKMPKQKNCKERDRLREKSGVSLSEWLNCMDQLRITPKNDPSYRRKTSKANDAHKRLEVCNAQAARHLRGHGCWYIPH